jgi:hypothetical protein
LGLQCMLASVAATSRDPRRALNRMRRAFPFLAILPLAFLASGCVYALQMSNEPTHVKLRVQSSQAERHAVRVALDQPVDYPVAPDGRVEFTVPRFHHGCDVYVLGFIKTRDGSAESVRVVEVRRAERVLRKLSLSQIAKLPIDDAGYSLVRIGD